MSRRPIHWAGSHALLVECTALADVLALHAHLRDQPLPGQIDLIPAMQTLLVKFDSHRNTRRARTSIADVRPAAIEHGSGRAIEIEVIYDGEDLESVGRLTGLGADGVIDAHTSQPWRAAFGGFAPGFVYLAAESQWPDIPRRDTPRTAVPSGSVALAGQFSAIYPNRSPGGWQLIGRTNARMWDIERDEPALILPGDRVRYKAVRQFAEPAPTTVSGEKKPPAAPDGPTIEIISPGPQSLIEDLGRPDKSHLGLPVAGAVDEAAARQANRLVGNTPQAAVIETLGGGLTLRARGDLVLARTGASASAGIDDTADGTRPAPLCSPFVLHDGETLTLAAPERGLRSYFAVHGGIESPSILGSRAADTMSGIEATPLTRNTMLPVGAAPPSQVVGAGEPSTLAGASGDAVVLRVILGPRDDWFSREAVARLTSQPWYATDQSNRIGVRLVGDRSDPRANGLQRRRSGELKTEGMVTGALQVPPSGQPILFLNDHPVTGGYPVIAVIISADLSAAAQIAPGDAVRFRVVAPDTLQPFDTAMDTPATSSSGPETAS